MQRLKKMTLGLMMMRLNLWIRWFAFHFIYQQRKLASVSESTSIANYIGDANNAANIEVLADAIKRKEQVILMRLGANTV